MELVQEQYLLSNKKSWDDTAPRFFGRTALPAYGPYLPTENELHLFGDITNKRVLEMGCGSGHSLLYMASQDAAELWGIDLSDTQIHTARGLLAEHGKKLHLFQGAMEKNPGVPSDYFDVVYSIYALGWTVDLRSTLHNVYSYLKPGGTFIFSWEHPLHSRVSQKDDQLVISRSYHDEGLQQCEPWNSPAIVNQMKLGTYVNELIQVGFRIERVVEDVVLGEDNQSGDPAVWYTYQKAALIPPAFIIKCTKL
ncbi:methyltransferase family protein [Paenibacillus cellulosilyticus]|uniref:Methyltransferase family protein n=1 Tax=Paenibacillus cellulosilyticus TaxID=375489 RepID=A0A2V2Z015_9BACL|nr:class I SAM-dependent methyltransferase [Paenibacillus cellulosilyticus]PWW08719.1 methyltransferase family protein [Paenibacillus cellulosilyticus]QKS48283.1 class I SAM-dependent methyltransferase [Paenibacillus cellulosilyticus]